MSLFINPSLFKLVINHSMQIYSRPRKGSNQRKFKEVDTGLKQRLKSERNHFLAEIIIISIHVPYFFLEVPISME